MRSASVAGTMLIDVTAGAPDSASVDVDLVRRELGRGEVTVHPVNGGLRAPGSETLIACAAITGSVECLTRSWASAPPRREVTR